MEQNEESDYAAEGFTLLELKQKFEMTYPAALLTIDWLLKEPDMAKKAIATGGKWDDGHDHFFSAQNGVYYVKNLHISDIFK